MDFDSRDEQVDFEYMLRSVFEYVPAGVRKHGEHAGQEYDGFYWRDCPGNYSGWLMVWYDEKLGFRCIHTYHYPPEIFK